MKKNARLLVFGILTVFTLSAFVAPSYAQAKDPDGVAVKKATYDAFELRKNLTGPKLSVSNESVEKITFKINVDEEGDVSKLTYSHNVTTMTDQALQRYIQNAYKAIMNTDFEPATKEGKPVSDTLTIKFEVVG